jgi:hypothetical protein
MADASFSPTHTAPSDGMDAWSEPDPNRGPDNRLDPDLPVQVLEETTGWARVRCSNGWKTWVDASELVVFAPDAFTPTHTVTANGLETREAPDFEQPANDRLDPGLRVRVTNHWGDWAKVRCENDWETWVDARGLAPIGRSAAVATGPVSPLAMWLPVIGAAVAVLGGFLPWYSAGGESITAWDIPIVSLFTHDDSDLDLKTGVVLLLVIVALLPLLTGRPLPRLAAGALAGVATNVGLLGFILYFDLPEPRPDIGIGLVLVVLGGIAMAVGPFVPAGASARSAAAT